MKKPFDFKLKNKDSEVNFYFFYEIRSINLSVLMSPVVDNKNTL